MINKKRLFPLLFLPLAFENVVVYAEVDWGKSLYDIITNGIQKVGWGVLDQYTTLDPITIAFSQAATAEVFDIAYQLGESGAITQSELQAMCSGKNYTMLVYYDESAPNKSTVSESDFEQHPENVKTYNVNISKGQIIASCGNIVAKYTVPEQYKQYDLDWYIEYENSTTVRYRLRDVNPLYEVNENPFYSSAYSSIAQGYRFNAYYPTKEYRYYTLANVFSRSANGFYQIYMYETYLPDSFSGDFSRDLSGLKEKLNGKFGEDVVDEHWQVTEYDEETGSGSASYPLSMPSIIEVPQMPSDYPVMKDVPENLKSGLSFWYDCFNLFADTLHFKTLVMAVCAIYLVFVILDRR